jgi:hypothetical protein
MEIAQHSERRLDGGGGQFGTRRNHPHQQFPRANAAVRILGRDVRLPAVAYGFFMRRNGRSSMLLDHLTGIPQENRAAVKRDRAAKTVGEKRIRTYRGANLMGRAGAPKQSAQGISPGIQRNDRFVGDVPDQGAQHPSRTDFEPQVHLCIRGTHGILKPYWSEHLAEEQFLEVGLGMQQSSSHRGVNCPS